MCFMHKYYFFLPDTDPVSIFIFVSGIVNVVVIELPPFLNLRTLRLLRLYLRRLERVGFIYTV